MYVGGQLLMSYASPVQDGQVAGDLSDPSKQDAFVAHRPTAHSMPGRSRRNYYPRLGYDAVRD